MRAFFGWDDRENACHFSRAPYFAHPMPKSIARRKTKKAVAKRFKITGTGKILRSQAGKRHLLQSKSAKTKRQLAKSALVDKTDMARIKENLPFA